MDKVIAIITSIKPGIDLRGPVMLIDEKILDSFDIVTLVCDLNDAFDIDITYDKITPENFNTIESIYALIQSLQNAY